MFNEVMFLEILLPLLGYLMDVNYETCGPVLGEIAQNDLNKQLMKKLYG